MNSNLKNRKRGVSLIGLLIGAAILSAVIIPFYLAFQATRRGGATSLNSLIGANVAAGLMEKYKAKTFSNLEALMLGIDPEHLENSTKYINGPFQAVPPLPTVIERETHRAGKVIFNGSIYISYFPEPNPNPDSPDFDLNRKRLKITVDVSWNEKVSTSKFRTQHFIISTMLSDEKFSSRPSYKALGVGGNN